MAFAEIVVYNDIVTLFDQLFDDHAADVTGPAGDQNLHESLIDLTRRVNAPPIYECAAGGTPRVLNRAAGTPPGTPPPGTAPGITLPKTNGLMKPPARTGMFGKNSARSYSSMP